MLLSTVCEKGFSTRVCLLKINIEIDYEYMESDIRIQLSNVDPNTPDSVSTTPAMVRKHCMHGLQFKIKGKKKIDRFSRLINTFQMIFKIIFFYLVNI